MIVRFECWGSHGNSLEILETTNSWESEDIKKRISSFPPDTWFYAQLFADGLETFVLFYKHKPVIKLEYEFKYPPRPGEFHAHGLKYRELAAHCIQTYGKLSR